MIALIVLATGRGSRCLADQPDRYGPFNLLDHRSTYGTSWFPEPLTADEADLDNEVRMDWFHGEQSHAQSDDLSAELEKSIGLFTFEIAPSWESDRVSQFFPEIDQTLRTRIAGFGNVELGGRFPFYEHVDPSGFWDTTFVFGMEVAVPTRTEVSSQDWELVPKVFNLTRIGQHLAVQTGLGDSILVGPVGRGLSMLEYNAVFGYELTSDDLPLPGVLQTWPLLEFDGDYTLNQADAGHNALFATAGVRLNLDSLPLIPAQPRLGFGYTFPIDQGAREEFHWAIVTSLIFEY